MITYRSKLLSNLVLTPVSSSDPPGSDLQQSDSQKQSPTKQPQHNLFSEHKITSARLHIFSPT